MRYYESRQFDMLRGVSSLLKKHQKTLENRVPAMKEAISRFSEKQNELYNLRFSGPDMLRYTASQKTKAKKETVSRLLKLSAAIRAYAAQEGKVKLRNDYRFTNTLLSRTEGRKMVRIASRIIKTARQLPMLMRFGITENDLADAAEYSNQFRQLVDAPIHYKKEQAKVNAHIRICIKQCMYVLENMIDLLMQIATEGDEAMRRNYKAVRMVRPAGFGRPAKAELNYRKSRIRKRGKNVSGSKEKAKESLKLAAKEAK